VRVPGAWEIPTVVARLAPQAIGRRDHRPRRGDPRLDAALRLRGRRGHQGHRDTSSADTGVPVTFGVLTTDTIEQAIERAGTKAGNKGWEATVSAIEMPSTRRSAPRASSKGSDRWAPVRAAVSPRCK
jgi:6,7-dimethyl-8-ribityllumazine synthase